MQNAHGIASLSIKESCTVMFQREAVILPAESDRDSWLSLVRKAKGPLNPWGRDNSSLSEEFLCEASIFLAPHRFIIL